MQSYDEIIRIIKSLPSVKGVRLEVRMALFGVEWAASQEKATCVGIVDRWKTKNEMLMIKWEGWHQNKQCSLTALGFFPMAPRSSTAMALQMSLQRSTRSSSEVAWANRRSELSAQVSDP